MHKILITGINGQIGKVLSKKMENDNAEIFGLDVRKEKFSKFKLFNFSLDDKYQIKKHVKDFKEIDVLIHLATKIDGEENVLKSTEESINLNVCSTLNLIKFLPNLKHICFTSTYMVYGKPKKKNIKENHLTDPTDVYGASKLATEKFLQIFSQQSHIPVTILRLMGVYGLEKPHNQAIPSFIKLLATNKKPNIFGDGKIRRNHIHVNDVVDAILRSIKKKHPGIYNIGGKESPSNLELIKIINKKMKKNILPNFKENDEPQYDFITDITKAKRKLQFYPKMSINDGIEDTIKKFYVNKW